jgi:hypothetical protein
MNQLPLSTRGLFSSPLRNENNKNKPLEPGYLFGIKLSRINIGVRSMGGKK